MGCHRDGEVAPFPLDRYEQAAKRAQLISQVVQRRYMPPWKPTPLSVPFLHERRLAASEIALIAAWAAGGAPRGAAGSTPPSPATNNDPPAGATYTMPVDFELPAQSADLYRCFVVPFGQAQPQWVNAFEFLPGNRRVVHHALVFFDTSGTARKLDALTPEPGYPCVGTPGFLPTASLGGWSPGNRRLEQPPGTAVRAPAGADLVFQIHYHATGKPERDRSAVRLEFTATPPVHRLLDIPLTSNAIDIPAGQSNYLVRDRFEVPVDVTLWQIIPHAHFVARSLRAWATLPGHARRIVLAIDDWDFNWQDIYQLKRPFPLPAGTLLEMEIRYDNSTANPRNPFRPPQRIRWGPGINDEMAGMHFNVTVDDEKSDLEELTASLWGKMIRATRTGTMRR